MLGWFAETTLVASGLALVAALVGRLRPIGPTARHALWLVVLIKLMTPPVVCWPWAVPWPDLVGPVLAPVVDHDSSAAERSGAGLTARPSLAQAGTLEAIVADAPASPRPAPALGAAPDEAAGLVRGLAAAWLGGTVLLGIGQARRIIRFRRRLRAAVPVPDAWVAEAEQIGRLLGVRAPELLAVPELGTPLLWCLGRPKLLLPATLVQALDLSRWRGILTHELAHLRRGDHWVSRLELAAGLIWWWNPLYWLTRARLDAEAELACDAWVLWVLPKDRLTYAQALFDICSILSRAGSPAPALGAAGSGRFFERRLTMILHHRVPCRLSPLGLLAACLLVVFALPSWSVARPAADEPSPEAASVALASIADPVAGAALADDDDDDEDDDDKPAPRARKAQAPTEKTKAKAKEKTEADVDLSRIQTEIESQFGPGSEFEKKMEALGEKIGKEMEAKFGPGSEFEKKMKDLGKEMEARFGPGSEFEKKMKDLGKEMEAKFGPVSEIASKIAAHAIKQAEADLKRAEDRVEWARRMREKGYVSQAQKNAEELALEKARLALEKLERGRVATKRATRPARATTRSETSRATTEPKPATRGRDRSRDRQRRIEALEDQLRKLMDELEALKDADRDEDQGQ